MLFADTADRVVLRAEPCPLKGALKLVRRLGQLAELLQTQRGISQPRVVVRVEVSVQIHWQTYPLMQGDYPIPSYQTRGNV